MKIPGISKTKPNENYLSVIQVTFYAIWPWNESGLLYSSPGHKQLK